MQRLLLFFVLLLTVFSVTKAQKKNTERPKVLIGLVVDQMRWDYLYRYQSRFTAGGFRRLMAEGYNFNNARINYAPSVTAAGHASIYTGTLPAYHGIIGNDWQNVLTGTFENCVRDKQYVTIGSPSDMGRAGPHNLMTSTLGDELQKAQMFKSKVYSIALKDRSAILPGGTGCQAAYWFDDSTGRWISSSYYMNQLPQWVEDYNNTGWADSMMKKIWHPLYPTDSYLQSTADDSPWERPLFKENKPVFPHRMERQSGHPYLSLCYSPFGTAFTFDFAKKLIQEMRLGKGELTDMLCVSVSSTDMVGHNFGPRSMEMEDMMLRLDKDLQMFLNFLDSDLGKGQYLLFLTSDHGVADPSEWQRTNHLLNTGARTPKSMLKLLNDSCRNRFGVAPLKSVYSYQLYWDNIVMASMANKKKDFLDYILGVIRSWPEVYAAFSYDNFSDWPLPQEMKTAYSNGYLIGRSGDIQIIMKPGYSNYAEVGVDHATVYDFDVRIPLLFFGWDIQAGQTFREVHITDIAPTIAAKLRIPSPGGLPGNVLSEVCP